VTSASGRAVVTVGAGPEQAERAALINPLAPDDEVADRSTLDLADADAARGALLDGGFGRCGPSARRDHEPTGPCAWASSSAAIWRSHDRCVRCGGPV